MSKFNKSKSKVTFRYEITGDESNDRFIDRLELAMLAMVRRFDLKPDRSGDIRFEMIVDVATLNCHGEGTGEFDDIERAEKAHKRRQRKANKV